MSGAFVCDTKPWFCVAGGEGLAPPRLRRKTMVLRNVSLVCAVADNCVVGMEGLAPPLLRRKPWFCVASRRGMSAVSHSRHVCCVSQQTCLLCHTADMSAVSHSRHVCCVTQQTCLLCHTADMSAVSHSRHVCCVPQQTCLLCDTADMSAVSHSRHVPGHKTRGKSQTQMVTPHCIQT